MTRAPRDKFWVWVACCNSSGWAAGKNTEHSKLTHSGPVRSKHEAAHPCIQDRQAKHFLLSPAVISRSGTEEGPTKFPWYYSECGGCGGGNGVGGGWELVLNCSSIWANRKWGRRESLGSLCLLPFSFLWWYIRRGRALPLRETRYVFPLVVPPPMVLEPFGGRGSKRRFQATIRQLVRVTKPPKALTWTVQETVRLKTPPGCQMIPKAGHWQNAAFSGEGRISWPFSWNF